MSSETGSDMPTPPVLVLGIGNRLLTDDGVGLRLLTLMQERFGDDPRVECVDGGTQGLALLGYLQDRKAVVFLDAIAMGAAPGTVHNLTLQDLGTGPDRPMKTSHETGAIELIGAARLLGDLPGTVRIIGIEPDHLHTSVDLTPAVARSLPQATRLATGFIESLLA